MNIEVEIVADHTTKQLANRLDLKVYQLNYLIDTGQIPDAKRRISNRRLFNPEEVLEAERVVREIKNKAKKKA